MLGVDLSDQVAVVTGVSSGVGLGVARMLARAGCRVVGCGTSKESSLGATNFIETVESEGQEALYIQTDVTNSDAIDNLIERAIDRFLQIDILVSNAGLNVFEGAENCSDESWEFNMELNLKAHWQMSKRCKPWLDRSSTGTIILMTSNHSDYTIPGCFPYNVTKTAIKGLVQTLAIEWGPSIRTVGLAPGFIDTEGNNKWFASFPDAAKERERTENLHPVKRIGTVNEVGGFCAFLCSDMAAFMSGTTYLMDGGRSALMQD